MRLQATEDAPAPGALGVADPRADGVRELLRPPELRELWLSPDARELRRARGLAETAAAEQGLDEEQSFRFVFAANEAVANAIEHGAPSEDGRILVRACARPDGLSFEVHDWGSFSPGPAHADALPERGRGLALMATMVDEVDVRPGDGSTVVRLVIRTG